MKSKIFTILALLAVSLPAYSEKPYIPKENQTIIEMDQELSTLTNADTQKALTAVINFLVDPEKHKNLPEWQKNEIRNIFNTLGEYKVQYWRKVKTDKKIIYCNFFHSSFTHSQDWKNIPVMVDDGGNHFWQIECDLDTGECFNFSVNGDA